MITGTSGRISFTFGSISSPVMPGMLMSERIRISDCSMVEAMRDNASAPELAKSITKRWARRSRRNLLAEQRLDIGLVIHHEN